MAPAFDTLAYARRLREGGFTEQQAETQAAALAAAMTENLATKQDLAELRSHIDARFERIDLRFEKVDARFEKIDARFERIDERFGTVDTRFEELEKRLNLSTGKQIADLRSQMTLQLMVHTLAIVGAVSALVKLL